MENSEPELKKQKNASDEIDLVDLFLTLWNHRLIIVLVALLSVFIGVGICVIMPKVYEISAILEPGRDSEGALFEEPQTIRENILAGAYNIPIAEKLNVELNNIPDFKVTVPKDTDLVKIVVESSDPGTGVEIVSALLQEISDNSKSRLGFIVENARNQIKSINLKSQTLNEQIELLDKQLKIVRKSMVGLENGRRQAMTSSSGDALTALLYSNELQNIQIYLNDLRMDKSNLEGKQRDNNLELSETELKLLLISGVNINKHPTVPENAIKPKKLIVITLSMFLGVVGGIFLAVMSEFLNKVRRQKLISARSCT